MNIFKIFLVITMILSSAVFSFAQQEEEELTLTTYYPAPYGEYLDLGADRFAAGPIDFGSDPGDVTIAGNVGMGTASPQAKLDVSSTTSGFLPPRMTTVARDANVISPDEGEMIYNTSQDTLDVHDGNNWKSIGNNILAYNAIEQVHPNAGEITEVIDLAVPGIIMISGYGMSNFNTVGPAVNAGCTTCIYIDDMVTPHVQDMSFEGESSSMTYVNSVSCIQALTAGQHTIRVTNEMYPVVSTYDEIRMQYVVYRDDR